MLFEMRKREEEMLSRIEPLYKEAAAVGAAPKAQLDGEQVMLRAACRDYINSRNAFVNDMLRVLEAPVGVKAPIIKNILNTITPVVQRSFSGRLRNIDKPTPQADLFCIRVENEEAAFVNGINKVIELAAKRDYAVQYDAVVKKQTEDLDVRWNELTRQHANFDANQKRIAEDLLRLFKEASSEAASKTATNTEKAVRLADAVLKTPLAKLLDLNSAAGDVLKILKEATGYWKKVYDMTPVRKQMFTDAYKSETGTTLVLFRDFKDETRRFMDNFGYEKLLKECDRGEAAMEEYVASCATDAQKADLRVFVDEAKRLLRLRRDEGKSRWDDFVKKHEYKFFGPLAPAALEALLSTAEWKDRKSIILNTHANLLSLLKAWRDETKSHQFISLASKGADFQLLLGPIVEEMLQLHVVWEQNMRLQGDIEALEAPREQDSRALS